MNQIPKRLIAAIDTADRAAARCLDGRIGFGSYFAFRGVRTKMGIVLVVFFWYSA